jgi:hypothetical protein
MTHRQILQVGGGCGESGGGCGSSVGCESGGGGDNFMSVTDACDQATTFLIEQLSTKFETLTCMQQ